VAEVSTADARWGTIPRMVLDTAARYGPSEAFVDEDRRVTYSQLGSEVVAAAQAFVGAQALGDGEHVALEVAEEDVAEVAVVVWLVGVDDEVAAELTVELATEGDLVDGELTAALLCWPLVVDPSVSGAADSVPVGASCAGLAPAVAASPNSIAAAMTTDNASKPAMARSRMMFRRGCRTAITPFTVDVTAAPSTVSIRLVAIQPAPPPSRRPRTTRSSGWTKLAWNAARAWRRSPPAAPNSSSACCHVSKDPAAPAGSLPWSDLPVEFPGVVGLAGIPACSSGRSSVLVNRW